MITNYEDFCIICGKPKTDVHHLVFGNAKRRLADTDGLTMPLCRECHEKMHNVKEMQVMSHIIGQLFFERNMCTTGVSPEEAREHFRHRYGISYL
jgi:hypothetical protein